MSERLAEPPASCSKPPPAVPIHFTCGNAYVPARYSLWSPHSLLPLLCPLFSMSGSVYLSIYLNLWATLVSYVGLLQEQGSNPHPLHWQCSLNPWTARQVPGLFCLLRAEKAETCLIVIAPSVSKCGAFIFRAPAFTPSTQGSRGHNLGEAGSERVWLSCGVRQIPQALSGLTGQGQSHSQSLSLGGRWLTGDVRTAGALLVSTCPATLSPAALEESPQGAESQLPHPLKDTLLQAQLGDSVSQQT